MATTLSMSNTDDDFALALKLQLELSSEDDGMATAMRIAEAADAADAAALREIQETDGAAMAAEMEREHAAERAVHHAPTRHSVTSGPELHDSGSVKISSSIFTAHVVSGVNDREAADTALGAMRWWVRQQPWASRVVCMPWAFRIVGADGTVVTTQCDDDGEFGAGGKLAHLLETSKAANVLVGVTRQGGRLPHCSQFSLTKFGKHRWPHFVGCARALLEEERGNWKHKQDRAASSASARPAAAQQRNGKRHPKKGTGA